MKKPVLAVPLDENEKSQIFDNLPGTTTQKTILEQYVLCFLEKNKLKGYETGDITRRKLIAALVFAVVLAAESAWFILYHPPKTIHPGVIIVFEAILLLVFFVRQNLARSLVRQVIRRPDDNLDNILISQVSGAGNGFVTTLLMLIPIAAVACAIFFVIQKPHMIFEKNDLGGYSVRYYSWSLNQEENVVIPETYKDLPVNEIRGNVFQNLDFRHITLPSGLTQIRASTFEYCRKLEEIVIPEGVTRIGAHAFCDCQRLASAVIPSTVTEIRSSAFRRCYWLKEVRLPVAAQVDAKAFKESPTRVERY